MADETQEQREARIAAEKSAEEVRKARIKAQAGNQRDDRREKGKGGEGSSANTVNEVDLRELENEVTESKAYLKRFNDLKTFKSGNLSAGSVVNGGFETARPPLKVSEALRGDSTNAFTRPTIDALIGLRIKSESGRIMTAEELATISAKLEGLGLPPEETAPLFWSIARYCADASSSPYLDPKGSYEFSGGAITRDAVIAVIRDHTTLRAFCRAYAPITWNMMLVTKTPPANWQSMGYPTEAKYAAFDVFEFVMNPAAIQPLEGLLRTPTSDERLASETQKRLAIDGGRRNARFSSFNSKVTGGLYGRDLETDFTGSNSTA
nr:MAG: coat protein [Xinjiang betaflexivirus 2]